MMLFEHVHSFGSGNVDSNLSWWCGELDFTVKNINTNSGLVASAPRLASCLAVEGIEVECQKCFTGV